MYDIDFSSELCDKDGKEHTMKPLPKWARVVAALAITGLGGYTGIGPVGRYLGYDIGIGIGMMTLLASVAVYYWDT